MEGLRKDLSQEQVALISAVKAIAFKLSNPKEFNNKFFEYFKLIWDCKFNFINLLTGIF